MARYDYSEQLWRDDAGAPIPCAHPESMGDHCCRAYELTGTRDAWTLIHDAAVREETRLGITDAYHAGCTFPPTDR